MPTVVVLGRMPRLLREIVARLLAEQDDVRVVEDEGARAADLSRLLEGADADVIVVSADEPEQWDEVRRWMTERARPQVVLLRGGARRASLIRWKLEKLPVGELSPEKLLETVRDARRARSACV